MIRISGYIISLFVLLCTPVLAQTDPDRGPFTKQSDSDSLPVVEPPDPGNGSFSMENDTAYYPGLRIGINIVRPLMFYLEPSIFGIEGVADFNIGTEFFAVTEAGFSRRNLNEPTYHLEESGMFLRLGADRNYYNHFNDVIGLGARLGFSVYERSAPFVSVEQDYWDEYTGALSSETFFRQWAEVVFVLKTEIFTNFFMGWNLRGKLLLFDKEDKHMNDRYIPGFGAGETNSKLGFDFYLYYRIPLRNANQ